MILNVFNSRSPTVAIVAASIHDDEPLLLPLTPHMQKTFNRRAMSNRKLIKRGKK